MRVQTHEDPQGVVLPVDSLAAPMQDPVQYMIHCIETDAPIEGPLSPAMARIGQQIVDSAVLSAATGQTVELVE